jgi:mannose-6-phosphate isomerase-like protein (cupin superfamily)
MSDFTSKNLMDLDNLAAGQVEGIDARFARPHMDSEHLGVSMIRYDAGVRAPYGHHHKVQEEAYVVVNGSGRIKLGDAIIDVKQWDVVRVAPEVIRGFEAGPDGLDLIIVGSDRPEEGDGVPVGDWWTD